MADPAFLARAIAGAGLRGDSQPLCTEVLDAGTWAALVDRCRHERMEGLLHQAVGRELLPVSADQRREVVVAHRIATARDLNLEASLLDATSVLSEHGIDHRVLKGPALAHSVYSSPELRHFGDVDLLVRPTDIGRAVALLSASLALRRRVPEIRPGFDHRFAKSVTLVRDDALEVDLHRTLVPGVYGALLDLGSLWTPAASVAIASQSVTVLPDALRLLHATLGAALADHPPRLVSLRDVAELVRATSVSSDAFGALAARHGVTVPCAEGVLRSTAYLGVDLGSFAEWARAVPRPPAEARRMSSYGHGFWHEAAEMLRTLPWRDKVSYAHALLSPSAEFRAARRTTRR